MSEHFKYVVVSSVWNQLGDILIFPPTITHSEFVQMLGKLPRDVLGAGFIAYGKCFGKSVTLGVKSRPEDTELFQMWYEE